MKKYQSEGFCNNLAKIVKYQGIFTAFIAFFAPPKRIVPESN